MLPCGVGNTKFQFNLVHFDWYAVFFIQALTSQRSMHNRAIGIKFGKVLLYGYFFKKKLISISLSRYVLLKRFILKWVFEIV